MWPQGWTNFSCHLPTYSKAFLLKGQHRNYAIMQSHVALGIEINRIMILKSGFHNDRIFISEVGLKRNRCKNVRKNEYWSENFRETKIYAKNSKKRKLIRKFLRKRLFLVNKNLLIKPLDNFLVDSFAKTKIFKNIRENEYLLENKFREFSPKFAQIR
jgi:hypothetical protein